jgi:hypothetical protein
MSVVERIARLNISLDDIEPTIWRKVEVPLALSLKGLHDVIQAVMPFEDYHLFEFRADGKRYAIPHPEWESWGDKTYSARTIKLGTLIERGVTELSYTYDFDDDWRHTITVEAVMDADPSLEYPRFIDGARRAPPEDVGGLPGFETFLKAMARPRHPEHRQLTKWYGGHFDPEDIGRDILIRRGAKLARRRTLGKAGFAKSRNRIN